MTRPLDRLSKLERELRDIFAARLQSLVAYGQASRQSTVDSRQSAGSQTGDASAHGSHPTPALTRTMAIVVSLVENDLRACAGAVSKWHDAGFATPLLLTAGELERSLDAFPLEFGAIIADYELVAGRDPFEGLAIAPTDLRRACEVQARSHLLHLREGFLETHGRGDAAAVLIVRSAAPFAALLASIARLQGLEARDQLAAGRHAERALQLPPGVVTEVVQLAHVTEISAADAMRIFPAYLDAAERLARYVDGWGAR
jgi:hypothetical protein